MKLFISGGTGFVGGHLCRELLARGHQLRLLAHSVRSGGAAGIEYFPGDVTDAQSCREGASGCDAVINLALLEENKSKVGMSHPAFRIPYKGSAPKRFNIAVRGGLTPRQYP